MVETDDKPPDTISSVCENSVSEENIKNVRTSNLVKS